MVVVGCSKPIRPCRHLASTRVLAVGRICTTTTWPEEVFSLQLTGVTKSYGALRALKSVSFDRQAGAHRFLFRQRTFNIRSGVPGQTLRQSLSLWTAVVRVNGVPSGTYQLFSPVRLTS